MKKIIIFLFVPFILNALTVKHIDKTIKIDGQMENVWYDADPVTGFIQTEPEEGKPASEKTEVYLLTDDKNLYIAFKCFTNGRKPQLHVRGWDEASGDGVTLYLDPFGDRRTGYYFEVSASGTQEDGTISRGGISFDDSWDGVWFAKSRLTDYGYCVEIKIPFKTIRYSHGNWGIQFAREIPVKGEKDYWRPVPQMPGFRIEQFGVLEGIKPETKGHSLEIYPVGIIKYSDHFKLSGGLDLSYNPTSEFGLNATILPDYAQIEADPFQVNLSQYALYLEEKRPFFIKGQDMFRIGRGDNFNVGPGAIDILYTRNIGKIINDSVEVPIYGGLKFTTRGEGFEGAAMYVNTGAAGGEPVAHYIALRGAKDIFSGALLGVTYTGKEAVGDYTRIGTFDGTYTGQFGDIITQFSYADSLGTRGIAAYLNYKKFTNKYLWGLYARHIDSTYNINEVGYLGAKGDNFGGSFGSILRPTSKSIRLFSFVSGVAMDKEPQAADYSKGGWIFAGINTTNNYQLHSVFSLGDAHSDTLGVDIHYIRREVNVDLSSDHSRAFFVSVWGNISYSFNYMAYHLGYQSRIGSYFSFKPYPNFILSTSLSYTGFWYENTGIGDIIRGRNVEDSYIIARPRFSYYFTNKLSLRVENEIVYEKSLGRIYEYRLNPLLVYNVSPKSNIYFVYSLTRQYNLANAQFETTDKGVVFKVRYLFYF